MSDPFEVEKNVLRSFKVGIQEGRRAHRSVTTVSGKDIPALARHPRAVTRGESLGRKLPKTDRPTRETRLVNSGKRDRYLAKSDPFELGKSYDKRNTRNNTRGQNIAAGAAGGVAVNAVGGAALGGAVGAHAARSGLRDLKAVGAAPSKLGAARIVTGHAARTGGKTALGLGTLGLLAGTAHGAMVGAKRRKPVRKNARRMDPAPATARLAGALPRHSPEAQAVAQAAATKRKPPVAAAIRGTLRATTIAKGDPFQPEPVAKKKIPAVLPGEKVAPRGFEPKRLPAATGRGGSGRGAQGQRRVVRSGRV